MKRRNERTEITSIPLHAQPLSENSVSRLSRMHNQPAPRSFNCLRHLVREGLELTEEKATATLRMSKKFEDYFPELLLEISQTERKLQELLETKNRMKLELHLD